jgi:rhomboid family GlyGly-CTERM serine protease
MGLSNVHNSRKWQAGWTVAAGLALLAIVLETGGEGWRSALAWDRGGIGAGEWWRLLSGHLVHLGWSHLALNLAGLALVAWVVGGAFGVPGWLLIAGVSVIVMDTGFWYLDPELERYVGLSGLLHGLLAAGLVAGVFARQPEALVLAACIVVKLAWEQLAGPLPGSAETAGGNVIVNAHLYGAVGGLVAGLAVWRRARPAAPI